MALPPSLVPAEISSFCTRCAEAVHDLTEPKACISFVRKEMPSLLADRELFMDLMSRIVRGGEFPDVRRPTMFQNEIPLYTDEQRILSMRLYLWEHEEYTQPHDHNSWGVIGTLTEGFEVINYRRLDDGSREGYARLSEAGRMMLTAGGIACTMPLDQGIHMTGNPTGETLLTLHVYGRPVRRGYLQGFDIARNRVYKILTPRQKKEALAAAALQTLQSASDPVLSSRAD